MEIFNTKYNSKTSSSSNNFVKTSLVNNQRLIPTNDYSTTIDEIEVYNSERENCDKYRVIVTINPICSNVLFNRVTEVVINEGSDDCFWLNNIADYDNNKGNIEIKTYGGKTLDSFKASNDIDGAVKLTRDTQLSSDDRVSYKCGVDIFNNHILRNKTFKSVSVYAGGNSSNYNTLFDSMRDWKGNIVKDYKEGLPNEEISLHLYRSDDVMAFDESVDANLIDENGWLGFKNTSQITSYEEEDNPLPINKVINNKPSCGFIDMCPERDLWYFTPKYNPHRNRYEKNWNYCLTYPSSSTTKNIDFIRQETNSLKIYYFDDEQRLGGTRVCKFVSCVKHGLAVDDIVNVYFNGTNENAQEDVIRNLKVLKVEDEYTFYVTYSEQNWIKNRNFITWKNQVMFNDVLNDLDDEKYVWSRDKRFIFQEDKEWILNPVFISNGQYKANASSFSNDVSFKQVINGEEVEYYVRIFSKLPNWKFAENLIDNFTTNEERQELIKKYSDKKHDFESQLSRLAFAKNSYGDDISQIVFTDDINLNGLTDNLGRPITSIFLTIIKNNAGFREWYGIGGKDFDAKNNIVEYSHVFGKNICGFKMTPNSVGSDYKNLTHLNNIDSNNSTNGLDISLINNNRPAEIDTDEIEYNSVGDYDGDVNFYGDLCYYSEPLQFEKSIDSVWFRTNTMQRELPNTKKYAFLANIVHEEIVADDYDYGGFRGTTQYIENAYWSKEGYIYQPHYEIPIKSFGRELQVLTSHNVRVESIDALDDSNYVVVTDKESYIEPNDKFVIHNKASNQYYDCQATEDSFIMPTKFKFTCAELKNDMYYSAENYVIIKRQETIPPMAYLLKDSTYRYVWRELYQNGFDNYSEMETYPFTNNALYIEKHIQFYCLRQDPDGLTKSLDGYYNYDINDIEPNKFNIIDEDYYEEGICF